MERQVAGNPLEQISWAFDASNQLTGEQTTQVASAQHPSVAPVKTATFALDGMGNRTSQSQSQGSQTTSVSWASNALNQFTGAAITQSQGAGTPTTLAQTLAYDALGNLSGQSVSGAGVANASNLSYGYDEANRLRRIVRCDAATDVPQHKSEFAYDGQNRRRIAREFIWNSATSAWHAQSESRFAYEGRKLFRMIGMKSTIRVQQGVLLE